MSALAPRTTFSTNRLLEFCSRKELVAQTGHEPDAWPLVIIKELIDNGLDSAEETGVAPVIHVAVARGRMPGPRQRTRHPIRDGHLDPGLRDPDVQPRGLCGAGPGSSGERAEDDHRDAVCAERRGGAGRDRRARHPSRDRLPGRSDRPAAGDRSSGASARGRFGKKRHFGDGALAGVSVAQTWRTRGSTSYR
jgi:hypothetical protein